MSAVDAAGDPATWSRVTGHYAGPVTRFLAFVADQALVFLLFSVGAAIVGFVVSVIFGVDVSSVETPPGVGAVAFALFWVAYHWLSLAAAGRTPAMAVVGLQVVGRRGRTLRARQALVRTLMLPASFFLFGAGLLWSLVDRERRALHDVVAKTVVVYDWGDRSAEMPAPLSRWLRRRGVPDVPPPDRPLRADGSPLGAASVDLRRHGRRAASSWRRAGSDDSSGLA